MRLSVDIRFMNQAPIRSKKLTSEKMHLFYGLKLVRKSYNYPNVVK